MSEVTLIINGRSVKAETGMTVLQAAQSVGIEIPTLCYNEQLTPHGGCRLCTVEIIKGQKKRMVTACIYPVEEGLIVETESEPVVKIRKMLLELMLASAPGVKTIMEHARRYEISKPRFEVEPTFCILCGLCVRYCDQIKGKHAIGFVGRGDHRQIMFFPDIAIKECPQCGECFSLCPTGVLPSNYAMSKLPNFEYEPTKG